MPAQGLLKILQLGVLFTSGLVSGKNSMFRRTVPRLAFLRQTRPFSSRAHPPPFLRHSFAPNLISKPPRHSKSTSRDSKREFSARALDPDQEAQDLFYGERIAFESLGLHPKILKALDELDRKTATSIQGMAIPRILSGKDIVMGAETGSGKTLAYMLPLFHKILESRDSVEEKVSEISGDSEEDSYGVREWQKYPETVILVPNRDLCEQAARMGDEISRCFKVENSPKASLEDEEENPTPTYGLEQGDREVSIMAIAGAEKDWPFRPRLPAPDILVCTPKFLRQFVQDLNLFANIHTLVIDEADMLLDRGGYENDINEILVAFKRANRTIPTNKRTQAILSAATIPTMGLKSVDKFIGKRFPNAEHVRADLMHKHHPSTTQEFTRTSKEFDDKVESVVEALKKFGQDYPKTILFANSAKDAQRFSDALMDHFGEDIIFPYHKDVPMYERDTVIESFRKTENGVLVCTDLGARGLDIPDVQHVIQGQFATNVVQHLHRIGRATRAGRAGRATNFFDESNEDLVGAILDAGEGNLDHSFSRRRGFRKTVRRYGNKFYKKGKGTD
ncbi:hypothetical protein AAMO2058_000534400 [Amorphochlora amoebiformis]